MIQRTLDYFLHLIDLRDGTDVKGTITAIKSGVKLKGFNLWILACSALLASIGLNTDSPAVIIGAMLISPLMAPILGIGLSFGINDREGLQESLRNYGIFMVASLLVSTLYFMATPLDEVNNEILSRTHPTILDVFIALFGGVAGIVAGSRKEKTNAIPGVAIATALMPPLCVAGFGIAKLNMEIFLGAFYLFFLNSAFISLATYLIVRYLRFPLMDLVERETRVKVRRFMFLFLLLVMIPSGFILFNVLQDLRTRRNINAFLIEHVNNGFRKAVDHEYIQNDSTHFLKLYMAGAYVPADTIDYWQTILPNSMEGCQIQVAQGVAPLQADEIATRATLEVLQVIEYNQEVVDEKEMMIQQLKAQIDSMRYDTIPFTAIGDELKILYPNLSKLSFAKSIETDFKNGADTIPLFLLDWKLRMKSATKRRRETQLQAFLKKRLALDTLRVVGVYP